jgi:hypothetical protein
MTEDAFGWPEISAAKRMSHQAFLRLKSAVSRLWLTVFDIY